MPIYLDLPLVIDTQGKDIYLFLIELKDVPGALEKLTNVIAENNIDIRSTILIPSVEKIGTGHALMYMDFNRSNITPQKLSRKIRELDVVLNVDYEAPKYGDYIVNTFSFPLGVMRERAIIFRVDWLKDLFKRFEKRFGSGGKTFLFYMGLEGGRSAAAEIREKTKLTGKELVEAILKMLQALGHGIFKVEKCDLEKLEIIITAKELYECLPSNKDIDEGSQFFRGYLSGVLTEAFKQDLVAIEVKCISRGDQYCEFHAQKTKYTKWTSQH